LIAEVGNRADAGSVLVFDAILQNGLQELVILFHTARLIIPESVLISSEGVLLNKQAHPFGFEDQGTSA
jgi:hypothetical protein